MEDASPEWAAWVVVTMWFTQLDIPVMAVDHDHRHVTPFYALPHTQGLAR